MKTPPLSTSATWTIDELAAKANSALDTPESLEASDSRFAAKLTARNIRSLQSQGAISKPVKIGREAFYGAEHFQELLDARKMMANGISAKGVQSLRAASSLLATSAHEAQIPDAARRGPADATTTADALKFLSGLSSAASTGPSHQEAAILGCSAPFLMSSGRQGELTPFAGAHPQPSLMSSGYQSMRELALSHEPPPACVAISRVEIEPFEGLRVSACPPAGSLPTLTPEQKAIALAAVEQAWTAAVMRQNSDKSK